MSILLIIVDAEFERSLVYYLPDPVNCKDGFSSSWLINNLYGWYPVLRQSFI